MRRGPFRVLLVAQTAGHDPALLELGPVLARGTPTTISRRVDTAPLEEDLWPRAT